MQTYPQMEQKPEQYFVIDANQNEKIKEIDKTILAMNQGEDEGFTQGLKAEEVIDTKQMYLDKMHECAIVLNESMEEAKEIVAKAHEEAQQVKQTAFEDAKQEGYQNGYQQAMEEVEQIKRNLVEEYEGKNQELQEGYLRQLDQIEPKFAEIIEDLLFKITGVTLEKEHNVILHMINNAMRDIENSHHFLIMVSEEDYPYLEEQKASIYGQGNPSIQIELFADAKLRKNQCIIETDGGLVEVSLDTQLEQLAKAIKLLAIE